MARKASVVAVIDLGACQSDASAADARFALRRLLNLTVLQRMVRRLSDVQQIDQIVITGERITADAMTGYGSRVEVIDQRFPHLCQRLGAIADRYEADWIYCVTANQPFVDPVLADILIGQAKRLTDCDYLGYSSREDQVRRIHQLGLTGELIHADSLRQLRRNVDRIVPSGDCQSVAEWISSAPGAYQLRFVPISQELDRPDLRFVVEDETDWDLAATLTEALGDERTDWQSLLQLVDLNRLTCSTMREQNAQTSSSANSEKFASSALSN